MKAWKTKLFNFFYILPSTLFWSCSNKNHTSTVFLETLDVRITDGRLPITLSSRNRAESISTTQRKHSPTLLQADQDVSIKDSKKTSQEVSNINMLSPPEPVHRFYDFHLDLSLWVEGPHGNTFKKEKIAHGSIITSGRGPS